jgi:acetyl esterase/lipase
VSWRLVALNLVLRFREKPYLSRETDFARARARIEREAAALAGPAGGAWREAPVGGVPALRLDGPAGGPVILWLHGGAYCLGSPRTHAAMVAALARRAGAGAVVPDYRLAPEHPFPAALEDALAAWRGLAAEGTRPASRARRRQRGRRLALALLHCCSPRARPLRARPRLQPWADPTRSGGSSQALARRDALIPVSRVRRDPRRLSRGGRSARPRASPRFGRFRGGPPTLIQSSRAEVLRDDARDMAARLRADGRRGRARGAGGVPHVWQLYHGPAARGRRRARLRRRLPEGRDLPIRAPRDGRAASIPRGRAQVRCAARVRRVYDAFGAHASQRRTNATNTRGGT